MAKLPKVRQSDVKTTESKSVSLGFLWRDRMGTYHKPEDMTTQHLFFTVRMVWNHVCPVRLQIHPFKQYNFSSYYTDEYLKKSVYVLSRELSTRSDLTPYFKRCILHMINNSKALGELTNGSITESSDE